MPLALPLYAVTLFVSAFILFLVQPIVGKIILPKLGGTPQVWNTCMVFFQMVLLAGYAYTHNASTRLNLRQQLIAHAVLLFLPLIVLLPFPFALGGEYQNGNSGPITGVSDTSPIVITAPGHKFSTGMRVRITGVQMEAKDKDDKGRAPANGTWTITVIDSDKYTLDNSSGSGTYVSGTGAFVGGTPNPNSLWGFVPVLGANPIPSTLIVLFSFVALPFVVVATTAPLLQKWFAHTGHPASKDPYFLYGASNLGSMLSLIVYPTLIEPFVSLQNQGWTYTFGFLILAIFVLACAAMVWNSKDPSLKLKLEPKPEPAPVPTPPVAPAEAQTAVTATAPAPTPAPATGVKAGQPKPQSKSLAAKTMVETPHLASDEMTAGRRFRWVMLAAIPSSLMLGITTHITTDLSPIPLFWLIPLILYLGSFILVFARWPVVWTEQPHMYALYAQPAFVWLMIMTDTWNLTNDPTYIAIAIFAHVAGFFATTMMCHGELAKDRPSTKHLTEFYLWMSVGGMCGGIFNGLISPIVFQWGTWEFPLAIFAGMIVRPKMFDVGLLDNWFASLFEGQAEQPHAKPGQKGAKPIHAPRSVTATESLVQTLDYVWPIAILVLCAAMALGLTQWIMSISRFAGKGASQFAMMIIFGFPLALAAMGYARPIRIGLGFGAVLLMHQIYLAQHDRGSVHKSRSYFGAISVKQTLTAFEWMGKQQEFTYHTLTHGHINHGMNFKRPANQDDWGKPDKDLSRLATTYYHREGPVGRVMEKYNWNTDLNGVIKGKYGPPNTYGVDLRLPASVIGAAIDPMQALASAWSEPPIATVGLGTGTMASYGRPFQHVHFYEIDNQILRLSLVVPTSEIIGGEWKNDNENPGAGESSRTYNAAYKELRGKARRDVYFNYLEYAIDRGCTVQVLMGDARLRMALPYKNHYVKITDKGEVTKLDPKETVGGGPDNFYHMMVVDAFSSDAIPAHLLTKQAFQMYFSKLTEEGILCVHTSNRFVDLPKVVSAVASDLGYAHLRGHDSNSDDDMHQRGHFTSEWVMVARKAAYLKKLSDDTDFLRQYDQAIAKKSNVSREKYWAPVEPDSRYIWTDDYYNLLSVTRFISR